MREEEEEEEEGAIVEEGGGLLCSMAQHGLTLFTFSFVLFTSLPADWPYFSGGETSNLHGGLEKVESTGGIAYWGCTIILLLTELDLWNAIPHSSMYVIAS